MLIITFTHTYEVNLLKKLNVINLFNFLLFLMTQKGFGLILLMKVLSCSLPVPDLHDWHIHASLGKILELGFCH
jgi:hypothetical protein